MVRGLTASASLHVALLAWAIVGFGVAKPHRSLNEDPVEVSVISVKDLETRQRKGDVNAKSEEVAAQTKPAPEVAKQEAPRPKPPPPQAAPPPAVEEAKPEPAKPPEDTIAKKLAMLPPEKAEPAPKPEPAKPEAKPEPAPDEIALQLAAEEAKRKAAEEEARKKAAEEAKKKAEEEARRKADEAKRKAAEAAKKKAAEDARRKAEADAKAKQQFDANKIALLIDKSIDKSGAPPPASEATNPAAKAKGPAAGSPTGKDTVNRAREEDLLKSRIQTALRGCWRVQQPGLPTVTVGWKLKVDGTLEGEPRVVTPVRTPEDAIAARAAIAAVTRCVPFDLPKQNYASWRDIEWDFNPSQMQ